MKKTKTKSRTSRFERALKAAIRQWIEEGNSTMRVAEIEAFAVGFIVGWDERGGKKNGN